MKCQQKENLQKTSFALTTYLIKLKFIQRVNFNVAEIRGDSGYEQLRGLAEEMGQQKQI